MLKFKRILLSLACALILVSTTGCRLIFEPETDAIKELFAGMPKGDDMQVRQMCDNETVCNQLHQLIGVIKSDWYGTPREYYTIDGIEIADDTGYSYVHISLRLPVSGDRKPIMFPITFEMERVKLRWRIYSVDHLDEYLRRASKARGIL